MNWGAVGLIYALAYAAVMSRFGLSDHARVVAGNVAMLVPPVVALVVILLRLRSWSGRQRVFWATMAAGAALWFVCQIAWSIDEIVLANQLPWFDWYIVAQLCASALPVIALVAVPHRGSRSETAPTATLDVCALACLVAFLYWSLIIAPGMAGRTALALRTLATVGPLVRLVAVVGFLVFTWAAAPSPWTRVYRRIAVGMLLAFGMLVALSISAVRGSYRTGSPADVGWMLPFWFTAWAAATAPVSPTEVPSPIAHARRLNQPTLLFAALVLVLIVGYGARYYFPLGDPFDAYRDVAATAAALSGIVFIMLRFRVEQRAVDHANERVRLLAMACEQSTELIAVARGPAIVYANQAFCRATGYSREELEALSPAELVASESIPATTAALERLSLREASRLTLVLARKDGTTFHAACAAAPVVAPDGTATHFVAAVRDLTDEILLRDQLVKSERLSAIGQIVSGVAHEINDPLQSVVGGLDVVLADVRAASAQSDLERIKGEASRAVKIIRNLIAFVRKGPRDRVLHDLNDIVRTTVSLRARELEHANIDLQEDYGQALPLVAVNRGEMQQIVMNLLLHAEQGVAGRERPGRIIVRSYAFGKDAVVEVSDNGWGVPDGAAARIFEPFVSTRVGGHVAGLGLSIAFSIAAAHGGTLELVPSSSAEGSCFRLRLPGVGFPGPAVIH